MTGPVTGARDEAPPFTIVVPGTVSAAATVVVALLGLAGAAAAVAGRSGTGPLGGNEAP